MSKKTSRGVTPSLVKSETFIITLVVLVIALSLPWLLRNGHHIERVGTDTRTSITPVALVAPSTVASRAEASHLSNPSPQRISNPVGTDSSGRVSESNTRPAPITYLFPYIASIVQSLLRASARVPSIAYAVLQALVFWPLSYPLALLLALLRPLTLLLEVIYGIFIRPPYLIMSWFVREAIYPLYVFTGVAVLLGASVGLVTSQVPHGMNAALALIVSNAKKHIPPETIEILYPKSELLEKTPRSAIANFAEDDGDVSEAASDVTVQQNRFVDSEPIGTRRRGTRSNLQF